MVEEENPLAVNTEKWMLSNETFPRAPLLAPIWVNSPRDLLTKAPNTLVRRSEIQKETQSRKMKSFTKKEILLTPADLGGGTMSASQIRSSVHKIV